MSTSFTDPLLSSDDVDALWEATKNDAYNTELSAYTRLNQLGLLSTAQGVPYDAIRHLDVTEVAKLVRTALRGAFPGFRFKVKSERFAGGTSIDVSYSEQFAENNDRVKSLRSLVEGFQSNRFCGMTDTASSISCWLSPQGQMVPAYCAAFGMMAEESHLNPGGWELVHSGTKFISSYRGF